VGNVYFFPILVIDGCEPVVIEVDILPLRERIEPQRHKGTKQYKKPHPNPSPKERDFRTLPFKTAL
jgi:hypothetical protein